MNSLMTKRTYIVMMAYVVAFAYMRCNANGGHNRGICVLHCNANDGHNRGL